MRLERRHKVMHGRRKLASATHGQNHAQLCFRVSCSSLQLIYGNVFDIASIAQLVRA